MLIGGLSTLFAFVGSLATLAIGDARGLESRHYHRMQQSRRFSRHLESNSIGPLKLESAYDDSNLGKSIHDKQQQYYHHQDRTDFKFAQLKKQKAEIIDSTDDTSSHLSNNVVVTPSSYATTTTDSNANHQSIDQAHNRTNKLSDSRLASTSTKVQAITVPPVTEYATVNYNGLIGINATDRYALTAESRTFGLPIKSQILMYLLYGTLAFTAIASNMIVCYIVLSDHRMRTATNYFIVNLAVGDILMALLCIPFTFISNLIYQYWPFGLSLCVIVSYAQANTVFVSAYTMVAISIDKYLAIMYPMRLRMPKRQAKILILVIWSAALLTSLPTALLSGLSSASIESFSTTNMTETVTSPPISPIAFVSEGQASLNNPSGAWPQSTSTGSPSNGNELKSNHDVNPTLLDPRQQQLEQPRKYFCQENWAFWPRGRYYYSTALMILQYVLPLFVLVITYSRIVIVVWGKRIPGEEDNARDARIARSKRKMIKMVIFCVIAFALTWLPFNALIVIGDMHPDIWEIQNIMYIWFITHFLAMCHTITNPLIYFWMNNRFRAGFKQVFWDLYLPMEHLLAYLWFWLCCFGCLLACSRRKYSRVSSSLRSRKQKLHPKSSSAGGNLYNNNTNNNITTTQSQVPQGTSVCGSGSGGGGNPQTRGLLAAASDNKNHHPAAASSDLASRNLAETAAAAAAAAATTERHANTQTNPVSSGSKATTSGRAATHDTTRTLSADLLDAPPAANQLSGAPNGLSTLDAPTNTGGSQGTTGHLSAQNRMAKAASWAPGSAKQLGCIRIPIRPIRVFARKKSAPQRPEADPTKVRKVDAGDCKPKRPAHQRRRKKQSHAINICMTTMEYRVPQQQLISKLAAAPPERQHIVHPTSCDNNGLVKLHTTKRSKAWWRKNTGQPFDGRHENGAGCPTCRSQKEAASNSNLADAFSNTRGRKPKRALGGELDKFIVDLHQSSQSTATISLQTNTTSLALSPLNSARAGTNVSTSASSFSASGRPADAVAPGGSEPARPLDQQETTTASKAGEDTQLKQQNGHSPPSKAVSEADQLRYMDETTESSDNYRQLTSQDESAGADIERLPKGKAAGGSSLSNSRDSSQELAGSGTSEHDEEEEVMVQYCHEHRRHMRDDLDGAEEVNDESLQTDDDAAYEVVFLDRNQTPKLQHAVRCNGSLEMLSDHFDDDDDDDEGEDEVEDGDEEMNGCEEEDHDEEVESLEAEFGDEDPAFRCASYAMVPLSLSGRKPTNGRGRYAGAPSGGGSSGSRQMRLLSRTFRSAGDDLNTTTSSTESGNVADSFERSNLLMELNKMTNKNSGRGTENGLVAIDMRQAPERSNSDDNGDPKLTERCGTIAPETITNKAGSEPRSQASQVELARSDRSLRRRAMLLDNHLLSSTGKISTASAGAEPNGHNVQVIKSGDRTMSDGGCERPASTSAFGARPADEGQFVEQEAHSSVVTKSQAAGTRHHSSCNGLLASSPVAVSCDKVAASRPPCDSLGGSKGESDNQSSSAPASITKNSSAPERPVINSTEAKRRQVVSGETGGPTQSSRGRPKAPSLEHRSLTSLSARGPLGAALDSFKSLDGSLALRPQDGTPEVIHRRRHELMTASWRPTEPGWRQVSGGEKVQHLIDHRAGLAGSKLAPGSQCALAGLAGGRGGDTDGGGGGEHRAHQRAELLSWQKSAASTLVVRKSPTVYLLSKTLRGEDHGK